MSDAPALDPNAGNLPQPPGLEAGAARRRLATWRPPNEHINSLLRNAGDTVLARARWLVRNNGYARAAVRAWGKETVGSGIKVSSLITDRAVKAEVALAWLDWTDEADQEGLTEFNGICRRVAREAFLAGECFVRIHKPFNRAKDMLVPLQLQVLPAEQLPLWRQVNAPNGNPVRLGIEFDRSNRRVAYWFWRSNPTDPTMGWEMALSAAQLVRVPAEEVLHIFDPVEAGQIRGLTNFAAAIVKLFMLDMYDDAELERKKQAARFATFVTKPAPEALDPSVSYENDPYADQLPGWYGPGAFMELRDGESVAFSEPADVGGNYEVFQYRTLLQISAATAIPYAELCADLNRTTYASSRAGLLAFRAEIEAFQHAVLVYQFLRPIYQQHWLPMAVLAGAVPISAATFAQQRRALLRFRAIPPRAPWVDPMKDRQAEALAVQNGFKSRDDVIEAEGYDPEEVDIRIAASKARAAALGLDFTPTVQTAIAPVPVMPSDDGAEDDGESPTPRRRRAAEDEEAA